jgi:hypothetical protein
MPVAELVASEVETATGVYSSFGTGDLDTFVAKVMVCPERTTVTVCAVEVVAR